MDQPPIPDTEAGQNRCQLIREAVRSCCKEAPHLLRQLRLEPVQATAGDSLVQLLLTAPEEGFLSVAAAPVPFEQRDLLHLPEGELAVASDKAAPSRRICQAGRGRAAPGPHDQGQGDVRPTGASPGSWTYVAVRRGRA